MHDARARLTASWCTLPADNVVAPPPAISDPAADIAREAAELAEGRRFFVAQCAPRVSPRAHARAGTC